MKLKCRINGKDYDLAQGASFADNFNETLDSGTICISQVPHIDDTRQYDDVFIWNSDEEFNGYYNKGDIIPYSLTASVSDGVGSMTGGSKYFDIKVGKDEYGRIFVGGEAIAIWGYRFFEHTAATQNRCRYSKPNLYFVVSLYDYETGLEATSTGSFDIAEENGAEFGTVDSKIMFTDGERSFECKWNEVGDKGFFIDKRSEGDGRWEILEIRSTRPSTCVINGLVDKSFAIRLEDMPAELDSFDMTFISKGIRYPAKMTGYSHSPFSLTITVGLENAPISELSLTFIKRSTASGCICLFKNSAPPSSGETVADFISELDSIEAGSATIISQKSIAKPSFYKHLLVDSVGEDMLGLETGLYRYTISLMSETKKLEKIQLPNISITQSLLQKEKRTCWFYLEQFVRQYSPKYKKKASSAANEWKYVSKYSLDEKLKPVFDKVVCPEMTLTGPSLKDVLSRIMIVKDMIPCVKDDVITALDIGNIQGNFDRTGVNFTRSSISSSEYLTDARREYSGALSQENSARIVEYIGFRSPNSPFLSLDNLTLEFRFPIYKINSMKMCYYKRAKFTDANGNTVIKPFLCKQDISKLVLLESVRSSLSLDWQSFNNRKAAGYNQHDYAEAGMDYSAIRDSGEGLDYAAQFKLCTIGYSIGSKTISGWGTTYSYLDFLWFKAENSYLENMINMVESLTPFGTMMRNEVKEGNPDYVAVEIEGKGVMGIIPLENPLMSESANDESIARRLKSIFFEVDYDAMYNGAVVHSKENADRDDITTADNCVSGLTVLESDGLFEREKLDRLGNKQFQITARYDDVNGGWVQRVGTYDQATDSIIFSSEFQVFDNCVMANYGSTHEYVQKNYFTSVWAKYRTYSLMSYGESVQRSENRKNFVILSKDKQYYEEEGLIGKDYNVTSELLSCFSPTKIDEKTDRMLHDEKINCGYFTTWQKNEKTNEIEARNYLSDINAFAVGTSLCFNVSMYDNISGGNYISTLGERDLKIIGDSGNAIKYKTVQKWYKMVESPSDAFTKDIGVHVCHVDTDSFFGKNVLDQVGDISAVGRRIMNLPSISREDKNIFASSSSNLIGQSFELCKDNKETVDFTIQFDYMSGDGDVLITPWACKLNDLIGTYAKFEKDKKVRIDTETGGIVFQTMAWDGKDGGWLDTEDYAKNIVVMIKESDWDGMIQGNEYEVKQNGLRCYSSIGVGNYAYRGEAFLRLDKVRILSKEGSENVAVDCELNGTIISINGRTGARKTVRGVNKQMTLHQTGHSSTVTKGGVKYKAFQYATSKNDLYALAVTGTNNVTTYSYFRTGKSGSSDMSKLDDRNAITDIASAIYPYNSETNIKNMFVVLSREKADKSLIYDRYEYKNGIDTFTPGDFFIDEEATVPEIFSVSKDGSVPSIHIDPSRYENMTDIQFKPQAVLYYYRTQDGSMHLVFAANLDGYEPFDVYLSTVSKRDMRVFDEYHRVIGRAANYANGSLEYGKKQYYEEE